MNLSKQSRSKVQSSNPFGDSFDESPEKSQVNKNPFDEDPDYDESLNPFAWFPKQLINVILKDSVY